MNAMEQCHFIFVSVPWLVSSTPFGLYLEDCRCIQVGMMFHYGFYQEEKNFSAK